MRRQQKLVLIVKRFDWEHAEEGRQAYRRRLTGVQFARVRSVRCRNIQQDSKDGVLMLLAVGLSRRNPAGAIVLTFAGGGA